MKELVNLIQELVDDFILYGRDSIRVIKSPYEYTIHNIVHWKRGITILIITSFIIILTSFPAERFTPPMFYSRLGWLILQPTESERMYFFDGSKIFELYNIINGIFFILCFIIIVSIFAWIISILKKLKCSLKLIFFQLLFPLSVSAVTSSIMGFIIFEAAKTDNLTNWMFIIIYIPLAIIYIYLNFIIASRAIQGSVRVGFWTAIFISIIAEFLLIKLTHYTESPELWYKSLFRQNVIEGKDYVDENYVRELLNIVTKKTETDPYNAFLLAEKAYKLSPKNLEAAKIVLEFKKEFFNLSYNNLNYSNYTDSTYFLNNKDKQNISQFISNDDDIYLTLSDFLNAFKEIPSAYLFAAETYALIGNCDESQALYHTVARHEYALPHERVLAIRALQSTPDSLLSEEVIRAKKRWLPDTYWAKKVVLVRSLISSNGYLSQALSLIMLKNYNVYNSIGGLDLIDPTSIIKLIEDNSLDSCNTNNQFFSILREKVIYDEKREVVQP